MASRSGRHFLQIPGPSNVPDRVLRIGVVALGLALAVGLFVRAG